MSILGQWQRHVVELHGMAPGSQIPLRTLVDRETVLPVSPRGEINVDLRIEREPQQYRGTGGVLCDVTAGYDDDELILVGNGAQVLLRPLREIATEMLRVRGDVVIAAPAAGGTVGLMLLRVGVLRSIAPIGYVDFKEQALPRIASDHLVGVLRCREPWSLPVRTLSDYIFAMRALRQPPGSAARFLAEDWRSTFSVVEKGAQADGSARLHDSVVLAGGRVEPGAVVVRSLVGAGGVVRRNQTVADALVGPSGVAKAGGRP